MLSRLLESSALIYVDQLFAVLPFRPDFPRSKSSQRELVRSLMETCEKRAVALFFALQCLLPVPLMAIYVTAVCDMSLFLLVFLRPVVDGSLFGKSRPMSAVNLAFLGVGIHVVQVLHFYHNPALINSPYGFCSNIFTLLITGFTSFHMGLTAALAVAKTLAISFFYRKYLADDFFYCYYTSCSIVLVVLIPVYLETLGRLIAETQAVALRRHMDDLLRASFDATIWCDHRFFILDHDDKAAELFAYMLPESQVKSSGRGLRSLCLFELISTDDRPRFKQYIRSLSSSNTSLFHTDLTCEQRLAADIYITSSGALGRQDAHLVGIRVSRCSVPEDSAEPLEWECPHCHCVNNSESATSNMCILCGECATLGSSSCRSFRFESHMNSLLSAPAQKLARFLLKRVLGAYIKPQSLRSEQMDVQLLEGELRLTDLELEASALNPLLAKHRVALVSGSVRRLRVSIPLTRIFSEKTRVFVEGVRLEIAPLPPDAGAEYDESKRGFGASETIALLSRLVQQILLNVEILVDDVAVVSVLPLKGGTVAARLSCREALVVSPDSLRKSLCVHEVNLELADLKIVQIPSVKVSADLAGERPDLEISVQSLDVLLRSPDHVAFLEQLTRLDDLLDDSAMFQSFVSEDSDEAPKESTVFWYEDEDNALLASLKQKMDVLADSDQSIPDSVDLHLRQKPLLDVAIERVTLVASIDHVEDHELRLEIQDLRVSRDDRVQVGEVSLSVVSLEPAPIPSADAQTASAQMFLSAIDVSSSAQPALSSPLGRDTPSSASAVSSPQGGLSTPGGSSVHTVQSLPEGLAEDEGVHEYEGPFFAGSLQGLLPRTASAEASARRAVETSCLLSGVKDLCLDGKDLRLDSDVLVTLEASDLAFLIATAGYLTSRLASLEVQLASAVERIRFPVTLDFRGKLEVVLACDHTKMQLLIPTVILQEDLVKLVDARFCDGGITASLIQLGFSKQSLPPPKMPRTASDSPSRFPSTDPSDLDGWTEILGKGQRRKPPPGGGPVPATVKRTASSGGSVTLKSRVHEPACFQISVEIPKVAVGCSGLDLLKLQIDLSTFADRFGAASIFFSQKIPVAASRWTMASPVKAAVDVSIKEALLSDLVRLVDAGVRVVSFTEPQVGPVTQLGVSLREVQLTHGGQSITKTLLPVSAADQSIRSRFDALLTPHSPLRENVRVFMTPQPRRGQGMSTFVTLWYSIEVGGIELRVDPDVGNFFRGKLLPYFTPPNAPLLPRPANLSPKAFTLYKLHVHDLTLRVPSGLALTVRDLESASGSTYQFEGGPPVKLAGLSLKTRVVEAWISAKAGTSGDVLVAEVSRLQGQLKLKERITEAEFRTDKLSVEVCADSLYRLKTVLDVVRTDFKDVLSVSVESPKTAAIPKTGALGVTGSPVFSVEVDEDFVRSLAPSLARSSPSKPGVPRAAPQVETGNAGEARWLVDPKSVAVLHDHVTAKTLPMEKPTTLRTLRAVSGEIREVPILFRLSLAVDSAALRIFDGDDWSGPELRPQSRAVRAQKNHVSVELGNLHASLETGSDEVKGYSVLSGNFRVGKAEVRDDVVSSVYQFLLSRLDATQDTISPQLSGNFVLCSEKAESRRAIAADVSVGPLCVTVDQDAAEYLSRFLDKFSALDYLDHDAPESQAHEEGSGSGVLVVASLNFSPINLELNYRAKRVSMAGLRRGDPLEYLNLLPVLEGLQLKLSELRLADVGSMEELLRRIATAWTSDLTKSHIFKSLGTLTPIRSIKNIFTNGFGSLIAQPVSQMRRKDGRVSKGIVKGVHSFFRTLVVESLALADMAVTGAHAALSSADSAFIPRAHVQAQASPVQVAWEAGEDVTLEWTPVERGAAGQRPYLPTSTAETLEVSSTALLRGIFSGIQGVRPADGSGTTVLSVARGLPLFVLRPALGATEAISVAVRSARGVVDSTRQKEQSRRYKAPFSRGNF